MALVIIYAVLSHFDFVAKFTVKNLNKDFTNTGLGGKGGSPFYESFFIKSDFFLKDGFPYCAMWMLYTLHHPALPGLCNPLTLPQLWTKLAQPAAQCGQFHNFCLFLHFGNCTPPPPSSSCSKCIPLTGGQSFQEDLCTCLYHCICINTNLVFV